MATPAFYDMGTGDLNSGPHVCIAGPLPTEPSPSIFFLRIFKGQGMSVHTFNSSTQELEVGESLWIWSQSGLSSELQVDQGYAVAPSENKTKTCFSREELVD